MLFLLSINSKRITQINLSHDLEQVNESDNSKYKKMEKSMRIMFAIT